MRDINVQGTECARCGDFFTGEPIKLSCGTLCETCVQVRMFDAEHPSLYPIKKWLMTNPERSVDEIVEEVIELAKELVMADGIQKSAIATMNFINGVTQTLQAERQRCDEAYKAGYIKGGLDEQVTNSPK